MNRKVGILTNGARKRGKLQEAANFDAILAEFQSEKTDGGECNSRLRADQRVSSADA